MKIVGSIARNARFGSFCSVPFRLYFGCVHFAPAGTLHSYGFCVSNLGGSDHCTRNCMEVATLNYGSNGTKPLLAFFTLFLLAACEMAGVSKY